MSTPSTKDQMMRLITGYFLSQAIHVAAELEIADLLAQGPKSAEEVAEVTKTLPDTTFRLLRALSSIGIFKEIDGRFQMTPLAEHLRKDSPETVWPAAVFMGEEFYKVWGSLGSSVRSGLDGFVETYGVRVYDYVTKHPERGKIYYDVMAPFNAADTDAILDAYDFSGMQMVVDVGGGNGEMLAALLKKESKLKGVLFDLLDVVTRAQESLADDNVSERCQFEAGDFFVKVPEGRDAYILRHIIHNWDDDRAMQILKCCRAATPASGRLLVMEGVILEGNNPSFTKWRDLSMLVAYGGKERTEREYRDLFQHAGFELTRIVPTATEVRVVEGIPV